MLHKNFMDGNFFMRAVSDFGLRGVGLALFFFAFRCPPFKILVRVVWANVSGVWLVDGVGNGSGFEKSCVSWRL
jgi:hypothetical protein